MTLNIPLYYHFYCLNIIFGPWFTFLDTISSFSFIKNCDEYP